MATDIFSWVPGESLALLAAFLEIISLSIPRFRLNLRFGERPHKERNTYYSRCHS